MRKFLLTFFAYAYIILTVESQSRLNEREVINLESLENRVLQLEKKIEDIHNQNNILRHCAKEVLETFANDFGIMNDSLQEKLNQLDELSNKVS